MVSEAPTRIRQNEGKPQPARRVGLVMRVSTDRQALNEEGSLKNQLQRLRQHVDYKRGGGRRGMDRGRDLRTQSHLRQGLPPQP